MEREDIQRRLFELTKMNKNGHYDDICVDLASRVINAVFRDIKKIPDAINPTEGNTVLLEYVFSESEYHSIEVFGKYQLRNNEIDEIVHLKDVEEELNVRSFDFENIEKITDRMVGFRN